MTDIIYYITDLTAETKRKHLLKDESKDGLVNLISDTFKKPIFRIFVKEEEKLLLEEKLNHFNFKKYLVDDNFRMGDFLMQLEEAGEL